MSATVPPAEGQPGRYGAVLSVYGRGGKGLCPRCGTPLTRTVVGGRGTSYCPRCQPGDEPGVGSRESEADCTP